MLRIPNSTAFNPLTLKEEWVPWTLPYFCNGLDAREENKIKPREDGDTVGKEKIGL